MRGKVRAEARQGAALDAARFFIDFPPRLIKLHTMKRLAKRLLRWEQKTPFEKSLARYRAYYFVASLISWFPIPVRHLLIRFGSDKHGAQAHSYGWIYQELFRPLKYRSIRLLEIGIGGSDRDVAGRSLLAWRAFFPRAQIIGFDMLFKGPLATRHVRVSRGDQGSPADLTQLKTQEGPFDVIIDDGSHLNRDQLVSFETLFDALKQGGLYIIEDVQTSFWPENVGGVIWDGAYPDEDSFRATCMGYFLELAKHLNYAEFLRAPKPDSPRIALLRQIRRITFEHNLIVVVKGKNEDPSIMRLLRSR